MTTTSWGKYDNTMLDTAELWAKHGTCERLQVGAVFARDERILVQGYNGAPKGLPHCDHRCDCDARLIANNVEIEHQFHNPWCASNPSSCRATHAEQNGIAWAARIGVSLMGSTLYCTHQPCLVCARLSISAGIVRVVYREPYRLIEGLELLKEAGVEVHQTDFAIDTNRAYVGICGHEWISDTGRLSEHTHKCSLHEWTDGLDHDIHRCWCREQLVIVRRDNGPTHSSM